MYNKFTAHSNEKENEIVVEFEEYENDDNEWELIIGKHKDTTDEVIKDISKQLDDKINNTIYMTRNRNICTIHVKKEHNVVEQIQYVKISDNMNYEIVTANDFIGVISKIDFMSKKYKVTCNHVFSQLDIEDMKEYSQLNKNIVINKQITNSASQIWRIKSKSKIIWYTCTISERQHLYIETNVTYPVHAQIHTQSGTKLSTVAIVAVIPYDDNLIYSGTVMAVDDKPFVVTYAMFNAHTNVTFIVALAAFPHNLEINTLVDV